MRILILGLLMALFACSKSEDSNSAPDKPSNLVPAEGTTCTTLKPLFSWESSDMDDDELSYTIWFGTNQDELTIADENITNMSFIPKEDLVIATKYYWQVEAHDSQTSTKSEISSFSTMGEGESGELPSRPIILSPKNDSPAGDVTFSWDASSKGTGSINYDLYVKHGAASDFTLLKSEIIDTSYTSNFPAGNLSWYIEANDEKGQTSRSEVINLILN